MALQVQQFPTFSTNGSRKNDDSVYITIVSASEFTNTPKLYRLKIPIYRTLLSHEEIREDVIKALLGRVVDVPQTFFNGQDCDMVQNLSRMLRDSIALHHKGGIDYFVLFIMVFKDSCWYNVLNCSCFFLGGDEQIPSSEKVRSLACGSSGAFSFPAGARAIELLNAQEDKEDNNCAICLQWFPSGSEMAKLPCSHIYHKSCVLEWFAHKDTCPLCRFPCKSYLASINIHQDSTG